MEEQTLKADGSMHPATRCSPRSVEDMWRALDIVKAECQYTVNGQLPRRSQQLQQAQQLRKRGRLPEADAIAWEESGDIIGCEGVRRWRYGSEACVIAGQYWDQDLGRLYLSVDRADGYRSVMDPVDVARAIERMLDVVDAARRDARLAAAAWARADRAAANAAADAALAAARDRDNEAWDFECDCGAAGRCYDDGLDMVQCTLCFVWAHTSCATAHLKGHTASLARLAAIAPYRYCCRSCRPRRYLDKPLPQVSPVDPLAEEIEDARFRLLTKFQHHEGLRLLVRREDAAYRDRTIVREVVDRGAYEKPALYLPDLQPGAVDCLNFQVVPGERWLDVGAHVGIFASVALHSGASVVAIEPDPDNFQLLLRNGTMNTAPGTQFSPIQAAVNHISNRVDLYRHPRNIAFRHSTHVSRRDKGWQAIRVDAFPLQQLLDAHGPFDAIKIDCQGAEIDALDSVVDWNSVSKLVLEYDFEYAPRLDHFHAFVARLKGHFGLVSHPKLKAVGNFVGFPTGVLVFALRRPSVRPADVLGQPALLAPRLVSAD